MRTLSKINFSINHFCLAIIVEPPIPEHEDQFLYENENFAKSDMSDDDREVDSTEIRVAVKETVEETLETVSYVCSLFFHGSPYCEGHVD